MRLSSPDAAPHIRLSDSYGKIIEINPGKRTLLAFFRDTNCPFCNVRIFQLTQRYQKLSAEGLDIIAFFSSPNEDVARFVKLRPRPFSIVADPENIAYRAYGVERSFPKAFYSVIKRFHMWIIGFRILGLQGTINNLRNPSDIMPADFLIDEEGYIAETYYGEDAGDHIPFDRIEQFLLAGEKNKESSSQ